MENMPKKETVHFDPETGKISLIATDKTIALTMASDGFFAVLIYITDGAAAVREYAISSGT